LHASTVVRSLCHRFGLAATVAASLLVPTTASAVTVEQIVGLAKAGVTDTVILALIDRDRTIFALDPDQLIALKADGVSEPVILAMLKSGRDEGDRAMQAASDLTTAMYLAERSPGPEVVIIGHGPDVPNTAHPYGFYSGPPAGGYLALPYVSELRSSDRGMRSSRSALRNSQSVVRNVGSPSAIQPVVPPIGSVIPPTGSVIPPTGSVIPPVAQRRTEPPAPRALCRADVRTATSTQPLSFLTECPPASMRR
jgi:hypothetical protein